MLSKMCVHFYFGSLAELSLASNRSGSDSHAWSVRRGTTLQSLTRWVWFKWYSPSFVGETWNWHRVSQLGWNLESCKANPAPVLFCRRTLVTTLEVWQGAMSCCYILWLQTSSFPEQLFLSTLLRTSRCSSFHQPVEEVPHQNNWNKIQNIFFWKFHRLVDVVSGIERHVYLTLKSASVYQNLQTVIIMNV